MIRRNIGIWAVILAVAGGLSVTWAVAASASGHKPIVLKHALHIHAYPNRKTLTPGDEDELCATSTSPHIHLLKDASLLTWQRRAHQDSTLTEPQGVKSNCRIYTAPSQIGWDRVVVRFKGKRYQAAQDWTISIVNLPSNPS